MCKRYNRNEFTTPNIILCEGADTTFFVINYLEYLKNTEKDFEAFFAFDFFGNENLPNFLEEIKRYSSYDMVKSILILRDSELSFSSSVQSVKSALSKNGYPVPSSSNEIAEDKNISVAFSLFPSLSRIEKNGTLEDLIINNLTEINVESVLNDVDSFLSRLQKKDRRFTWLHKSRLYTYFSVTDNYIALKLGEATKAGAFNFNCEEMKSLKDLLIAIKR